MTVIIRKKKSQVQEKPKVEKKPKPKLVPKAKKNPPVPKFNQGDPHRHSQHPRGKKIPRRVRLKLLEDGLASGKSSEPVMFTLEHQILDLIGKESIATEKSMSIVLKKILYAHFGIDFPLHVPPEEHTLENTE